MRVVVGLFASLVLAGCDSPEPCTAKGCHPGASLTTRFDPHLQRSALANVRVCRNDECITGQLTIERRDDGSFRGRTGLSDSTRPDRRPSADVDVRGYADGNHYVDVRWRAVSNAELSDGDVYRFEIEEASGAWRVADTRRATAYRDARPNGPNCAPICRTASFD